MNTERLNELEKLDQTKQSTLSKRAYSSWTIYSNEYRELINLQCEAKREQNAAAKINWHDDPATPAQISYLLALNVNIGDRKISKGMASKMIDAIKSGEGIGSFGLDYFDGSN